MSAGDNRRMAWGFIRFVVAATSLPLGFTLILLTPRREWSGDSSVGAVFAIWELVKRQWCQFFHWPQSLPTAAHLGGERQTS